MGAATVPSNLPKAKHVIMLYMSGGMSHIDGLDPKPENKEVQGDTGVISTNVDGIQVGEHFSHLSKVMDKCCIIRSMSTTQGAHLQGRYYQHTSYTMRGTIRHPSLGAWVSRMSGCENGNLPPSVVINETNQGLASSAGYMESKFAALPVGDPMEGLTNLSTPAHIEQTRQDRRLAMTQRMNQRFTQDVNLKNVRAYGDAYNNALRLMKSDDRHAFSIEKESQKMRELYGDNKFGQGCLLARRLVEHGVRFVEVMSNGWDNHNQIQNVFPENCSNLDRGLSALITDLNSRGLLEDTLIVLSTEFGRTPKINVNSGRDHYPKVYSHLFAGGGIRGGQVYGASDKNGAEVAENKVTPVDFNATIGYALGIPLDQIIMSPSGRPFQFAHKGQPLTQLFA
jgi:hypothetical protein